MTDQTPTARIIARAENAVGHTLHASKRLTWGERRALGVEYDELSDACANDILDSTVDRLVEIEKLLAANPLDSYSSEEIDKYNIFHFGDASGRGPRIHRTVETFSEATGLSVEMIQAHKITSYCSATGNPIHVLQEDKLTAIEQAEIAATNADQEGA